MRVIRSVQNENVKYYEKLKDKTFRKKEQKFILEGRHLVEEALKTNLVEVVMSTDEEYLKTLDESIETFLVNDAIIEKLSGTKNPQNILAIAKMFNNDLKILRSIVKERKSALVMFDEINDPGNLGTLIRTSAALGYDGVILSKNSCDIYNDKTVRASQGSIFKTKIVYAELKEAIRYLKEKGYQMIGTSLQKADNLQDAIIGKKFVLCLGNEARGISEDVLSLMDRNVKINMRNDVESLNVMVAGSIIMYELIK